MRQERSAEWLRWMGEVRATLLAHDVADAPPEAGGFFRHNWMMHTPALMRHPPLPAMDWTIQGLIEKVGDIEVQVQVNRLAEPDYERLSGTLRQRLRFADFAEEVLNGTDNDVYMTANNADANGTLMQALAMDLLPQHPLLRPHPGAGFLWIGKGTVTPLHHDLTNNLLVQLVGQRRVYLIPPAEQPRLENTRHVHSDLRTVDDLDERNIAYTEVHMGPGDTLFVPVGWWHRVEAPGISMMVSYTNFWWPNFWNTGFPD